LADGRRSQLFVVLYANSIPRVGTFIALAGAIQAHGYTAVVVIPDSVTLTAEELAGFEDVLVSNMKADEIRALKGVDLFFSSEVVHDVAPANVVTVGILHALPRAGIHSHKISSNAARSFEAHPEMIRTFDYVAIAVKQAPAHWNADNYSLLNGLYPPAFLTDRRPVIDIVPAGYPKLDYSSRILKSGAPSDHILYTPTKYPLGRVRKDAEGILRTLTEGFPDKEVVFRPYPSTEDLAFGRELANRLSRVTNFILDDSATGVAFQRRAALAVTDHSSSAMTFSIATGRPLVFAHLENNVSDAEERSLFGYSATSKEALLNSVRCCLDGSIDWSKVIADEAEENLYNPGGAGDYIAKRLHLMADRKSDPSWLTVNRSPWVPKDVQGAVDEHLELLEALRKRTPGGRADAACLEIAEHIRAEHT